MKPSTNSVLKVVVDEPALPFPYLWLRQARFESNWIHASEEEPWRFNKRALRRLNYRQAKKRLLLAGYWE